MLWQRRVGALSVVFGELLVRYSVSKRVNALSWSGRAHPKIQSVRIQKSVAINRSARVVPG